MEELDRIIRNAPDWIIGMSSKTAPGEIGETSIDIDGRTITPDELRRLIEAADKAKEEDVTINVIWNNQGKDL